MKETKSDLPTEEPNIFYMRHGQPSGKWGSDDMSYKDFLRAHDWVKSMQVDLDNTKHQIINDSLSEAKVETKDIKLIYASPYLRTQQTAEVVQRYLKEKTEHAPKIRTTELLREIDFDSSIISEPEYYELRKQGFGKICKKFDENWLSESRGIHENASASYERAEILLEFLRNIRKNTKYDKIMLVSHGMFGRVLQQVIQKGTPQNMFKETEFMQPAEIKKISHNVSTGVFSLLKS